jgi:hypothetical protein
MTLAAFCLALAGISSTVFAQKSVAEWFPAGSGNRWVYRHETRDDTGEGRAHLDVHRWKTEETITGSWTVPEGTLVGRRIRLVDGSPPAGYRVDLDAAYLIRGDCLYSTEVDSDTLKHQLTPGFREELFAGHLAADFCFPLAVHKIWGAPHFMNVRVVAEDWEVVGINFRDPAAPDKQNTFHVTSISSYPGSGMTVEIWFEKGVGIIREENIHHGTIEEDRTRLLHFNPAPR